MCFAIFRQITKMFSFFLTEPLSLADFVSTGNRPEFLFYVPFRPNSLKIDWIEKVPMKFVLGAFCLAVFRSPISLAITSYSIWGPITSTIDDRIPILYLKGSYIEVILEYIKYRNLRCSPSATQSSSNSVLLLGFNDWYMICPSSRGFKSSSEIIKYSTFNFLDSSKLSL